MERVAHNKFKKGEPVLHVCNGQYEVGVVHAVISYSPTNGVQQYDIFGHPIDEDDSVYTYDVRLNGADIVTFQENVLRKISNDIIVLFPIKK